MKKSVLLLSGLILSGALSLPAQDTLQKSKVLCFPAKNWGICFGNSASFSGLRFNFADRNVTLINGLNVTVWARSQNRDATVNGISAGLFPAAGTLNGINAGIMGVGVEDALNGLTVGGLTIRGYDMRGISLSGLFGKLYNVFGIALSGLVLDIKEMNGLMAGGLYVYARKKVNGLVACPGAAICSGQFNGVAVGSFVKNNKMNGLSIGLFNKCQDLHGIQIGLLNHAANNPKGLRWLPVINLHLGRK